MEKLEKKKHDHNLTKWLKFGIFAIIMVAPFLSVLSKCVYVAVNKNAKESYYGETINEEKIVYISEWAQVQENNEYYIDTNKLLNTTYSGNLYVQNITYISSSTQLTTEQINQINNSVKIYYYRGTSATFYDSENNSLLVSGYINLKVFGINKTNSNTGSRFMLYYIEYNKYSYLDNVFDYSVDELNNNNLFNWSKQTAIYTAIYKMTNGLGANEVLAMLLAYWGILTAIYIIFDIVIECFTKLTHLLAD